MSSIEIGITPDGKIVTFDVDGIFKQRLLVQGISGSGKSETVKTIIRKVKALWKSGRLHQQSNDLQVIILDFEGEYPILRKSFPLILIGDSGEIPISVDTATKYGEEIRKSGISCIIDLSSFKHDNDRESFVSMFINAILDIDKKYWNDCIIIIDEAHLLCSQNEDSESRKAIIRLCQTGRKRGIGTILVTQSIAEINKRASKQMANRIIGQCVEIADRERAISMLNPIKDKVKSVFTRLGMFESGEFFSFGRSIKVDGKVPALEDQPIEFKLSYDASVQGDELEVPPLDSDGKTMAEDLAVRLGIDDKPVQPKPVTNVQQNDDIDDASKKRLAELKAEEKALLIKKEISDREESIKKLKLNLDKRDIEKQYIISEPDEKGLVTIDKALAEIKLRDLKNQLDNTSGFWERRRISSQISKINTAIATAKMNNGMIRTGRVVEKIGTTISTISNSIGKVGESLGEIGGTDYNQQEKSNKKGKKQRKKKSNNQSNGQTSKFNDMGFNPENIFGDKSYNDMF